MRVLVAGVDGYLGWTIAQHLAERGHSIVGADALLRRRWVEEMGSISAIPIASIEDRLVAFREKFGRDLDFFSCDFCDYATVERVLKASMPDAVVHLAECPSAPYSMLDVAHARYVQVNNVTSTLNILYAMHAVCPSSHLVKLGSMGEYGTPNLDIPEGFFDVDYRGRRERLSFPRQATSWYHWSKVFDSHNVQFACQLWGMRATDIMQGVVYGTHAPNDLRLATRLDFDDAFGTVVHRFCCQAIAGRPLTQYGSGTQRRGLLSLADSMQCLTISIENPPSEGEYRVFNQLREVLSVNEIALKVRQAARTLGLEVAIEPIVNPRYEAEEHYYNPEAVRLRELGFVPEQPMEIVLGKLLRDLEPHCQRIICRTQLPTQRRSV